MTNALPYRFLLLPGFDLAALGAASTVLTEAGVNFQTTALSGVSVPGDSGVHVAHGGPVPAMDPGDTLVVFSGLTLSDMDREGALAALRRARRQGGRIWAVGGGVPGAWRKNWVFYDIFHECHFRKFVANIDFLHKLLPEFNLFEEYLQCLSPTLI